MANPHNKNRYGEAWDCHLIGLYQEELEPFKKLVIFSGGWAWHFMSPPHIEYKHAHDHKDVDIFVFPENVVTVINLLTKLNFRKVHTRFDGLENDFRRYEKYFLNCKKLIIDFFVKKDLQIEVIDGWQVVHPKQLLTFYKNFHSSDNCFAVVAAAKLIEKGIIPLAV